MSATVSRRRLFGLFAGAAAAPMVGNGGLDGYGGLTYQGVPLVFEWPSYQSYEWAPLAMAAGGKPTTMFVKPEVYAWMQEIIFGETAGGEGLRQLLEGE